MTLSPPKPAAAIVTGASRGIGLALVGALMANSSMTKVFAASRNATQDEGLIRQHVRKAELD